MVEQGLKVQTRTEQLLYRLYPRLTNFPQSEKFGLAARMTPKKAEQIVGSWGGHARYGCSRNFIARLVERHSFLHIKSGALRFDERGPCYV